MADFSIRVELRGNPPYETYQTLHAVMAKLGFYQSVKGSDAQGRTKDFALPHAVYYGSSIYDCGQVRNLVVTAVKSQVQQNAIVFVVQVATWAIG